MRDDVSRAETRRCRQRFCASTSEIDPISARRCRSRALVGEARCGGSIVWRCKRRRGAGQARRRLSTTPSPRVHRLGDRGTSNAEAKSPLQKSSDVPQVCTSAAEAVRAVPSPAWCAHSSSVQVRGAAHAMSRREEGSDDDGSDADEEKEVSDEEAEKEDDDGEEEAEEEADADGKKAKARGADDESGSGDASGAEGSSANGSSDSSDSASPASSSSPGESSADDDDEGGGLSSLLADDDEPSALAAAEASMQQMRREMQWVYGGEGAAEPKSVRGMSDAEKRAFKKAWRKEHAALMVRVETLADRAVGTCDLCAVLGWLSFFEMCLCGVGRCVLCCDMMCVGSCCVV